MRRIGRATQVELGELSAPSTMTKHEGGERFRKYITAMGSVVRERRVVDGASGGNSINTSRRAGVVSMRRVTYIRRDGELKKNDELKVALALEGSISRMPDGRNTKMKIFSGLTVKKKHGVHLDAQIL
jgi:hypothetical protein